MYEKFIIPQELKSQTKVSAKIKLYVSDLLFCIAYFMCFLVLDVFVDSRLHLVYYIFNIVVALILTGKSIYNPSKRIYQSLLYMLAKDRTVYHPISEPKANIMRGDIVGFTVKDEKTMYQAISEKEQNR